MSAPYHSANLELMEHVIQKISFSHFPIPISVRLRGGYIRIVLSTVDRDSKTPGASNPANIMLESNKEVPPWFQGPQDLEMICKWITDEVMDLLRHEVYEHFLLDGHRILDPHREVSKSPGYLPEQALQNLFPLAGSKQA